MQVTNRDIFRIYWRHMQRYRGLGLRLFVCTTAGTLVEVFVPLFYKRFFDELSVNFAHPSSALVRTLLTILLMVLGLKAARWGFMRVGELTRIRMQVNVMADLTNSSFANLLGHSHRFFADNFTGTLVRRVNKFTRAFEEIADNIEFNLWPLSLTVTGILAVTTWRSPILGGILFLWTIIFTTTAYALTRWRQPYRLAAAESDSAVTGAIADSVSNSTTIKLFASEKHEQSLLGRVVTYWHQATGRSWRAAASAHAILAGLNIVLEFGILAAAIFLWQRGDLTLGDFALLQAYIFRLTDKIWELGPILRRLYTALADASEMTEIFQTPHEIKDSKSAVPLLVTHGQIDFQKVDFSFHQTRKVLDNFKLTIKPGERVALVGSSGAGKSTITNLLFRFFEIDSGRIAIDGQSISDVTQHSLRRAIALVPQEPILFHRTLMENIRYGQREATDNEVIEAAKRAHCHEFIDDLPQTYQTFVGERGVKLSGGERQRVAIARAILQIAPILVLDEATSSLDSESEALIQDALRQLMQKKTVIVIAHRLSTILSMDRIIVIDNGAVVDEGTHNELLAKDGIYKKLWSIQAGGFLP